MTKFKHLPVDVAKTNQTQEIINYLNDVGSFWAKLSDDCAHTIDVSFIEALQGRCPKFSQQDHEHLQRTLEPDGILGHLPIPVREQIYHTTILYTRTIPSLFTFFQDWKYIQLCVEVLTGLLTVEDRPIHCSLRKCFESLFRPRETIVQTGHTIFQKCLIQEHSDRFSLAYWQLWLCAMRLWPFVSVKRGRKSRKSVDERFSTASRKQYWSLLAC